MKWISVKEREPNESDDGKEFLFVSNNPSISKASKREIEVRCGYWDYPTGFVGYVIETHEPNVTHWMPLPESPKDTDE